MAGGTKKTIAQYARSRGVDIGAVHKAARDVLGQPARRARDPDHLLHPGEMARLDDELGVAPAQTSAPPEPPPPDPEPEPDVTLRRDALPMPGALRFGPLTRGLRVHPEVIDAVERSAPFRKRLSLTLQQLAAHGRPAMVKGCADPANRGWFRTPFGGNGGMQWYVWWAPAGNRPTKDLAGAERDIYVRAVRHHDEHAPLDAGAVDDYLSFGPAEVEDDGLVTRPWTADQLAFVDSADPVRFVLGRPGSGKTTVLWKAIEARANERVLYLTWSRDLTRLAEERFAAFAPVDVEVRALDFVSFLGELCGRDVARMPLAESRRAFFEGLGPSTDVGVWRGNESALYAEVRAQLIGRAVPGAHGVVVAHGLSRLDEATYVTDRAGEVGRSVARSAVAALGALDAGDVEAAFPELRAAVEAIERLRADDLPPGFAAFDRVVVDEVQDLTLLDAAVVVELCRAIHRAAGFAPRLLVAGDDGQTVRPSGFRWGPLADLVSGGLAPPSKFRLEENLRCPARIAEIVQRASEAYSGLAKSKRPTKQSREAGGAHSEAFVFHVEAPTVDEARALVEQLDEIEDVVVLAPQTDRPAWLPPHLIDAVRTPAEVKGLEYQSVVVLDPGPFMRALRPESPEMGGGLHGHAVRTRIDQFRVALSRATETLAFVDVQAPDDALGLSRWLLDRPVPCDPDDLIEHFAGADLAPEDRVLSRMDEARALLDEVPRRAWRRATQAVRLLGDPTLPNGVSSPEVRHAAHETLVEVAARLLVDGPPMGVTRDDVRATVEPSLAACDAQGSPPSRAVRATSAAFAALVDWTADWSTSPVALLRAQARFGDRARWLTSALVPVHQRLRRQIETLADDPQSAPDLAADVEAWLRAVGYAGDVDAKVRGLRGRGVDTLIVAGRLPEAEALLAAIDPPDALRGARLDEAQGRHAEAAAVFERLGAAADAWRNWRLAGEWGRARALFADDAVDHPAPAEAADLAWLESLEKMLAGRPDGLEARLRPAERSRLAALLRGAAPG